MTVEAIVRIQANFSRLYQDRFQDELFYLQVRLDNRSKREMSVNEHLELELVDSRGSAFEPLLAGDEQALQIALAGGFTDYSRLDYQPNRVRAGNWSQRLPPGKSTTGLVQFLVPSSSIGLELRFTEYLGPRRIAVLVGDSALTILTQRRADAQAKRRAQEQAEAQAAAERLSAAQAALTAGDRARDAGDFDRARTLWRTAAESPQLSKDARKRLALLEVEIAKLALGAGDPVGALSVIAAARSSDIPPDVAKAFDGLRTQAVALAASQGAGRGDWQSVADLLNAYPESATAVEPALRGRALAQVGGSALRRAGCAAGLAELDQAAAIYPVAVAEFAAEAAGCHAKDGLAALAAGHFGTAVESLQKADRYGGKSEAGAALRRRLKAAGFNWGAIPGVALIGGGAALSIGAAANWTDALKVRSELQGSVHARSIVDEQIGTGERNVLTHRVLLGAAVGCGTAGIVGLIVGASKIPRELRRVSVGAAPTGAGGVAVGVAGSW